MNNHKNLAFRLASLDSDINQEYERLFNESNKSFDFVESIFNMDEDEFLDNIDDLHESCDLYQLPLINCESGDNFLVKPYLVLSIDDKGLYCIDFCNRQNYEFFKLSNIVKLEDKIKLLKDWSEFLDNSK